MLRKLGKLEMLHWGTHPSSGWRAGSRCACKETTPCCINCGDQHRTLAASCPLRKRLIKEKRTAIMDRSRSRSIQRRYDEQYQPGGESFASRTRPGITSVMERENKFELKKIMTTILSAIAYSHYMEAQYPGTFQENMNKMYKKNNLHPVWFPDEVETKGVLKMFVDAQYDMDPFDEDDIVIDAALVKQKKTTKEQKTTIAQAAVPIEMEMETTHKRSREELTPSPRGKVETTQAQTKESREGKRQKDEESKVEQTQQQQQQKKRQSVRQRTDSMGSVGSQGGSRYSSQDLGITVYMPPHDQYRRMFSKPLNRSNKKQIIRSLLQGQGKFSWRKADIKGEYILDRFKKNKINLSEVEFKLLEVEKTKDSGKEKSTRRTSSTSYNI